MRIETDRLLLRPLAASDAEAMHAAYGDPAVMRFWGAVPAADLAETAERVAWSTGADPASHAAWAVLRRADERLVGMVNYHHRDMRHQRLEIGYLLLPAHWRRGYMAEALTGFLDHCFGGLGAHRVEAAIGPDNTASRALVERLGFLCEGGPLRQCVKSGDRFLDMMIYGLLAPEWRARVQPASLE